MPRQNNIVLFLTDQWRWDTINDPNSPVQTPHIDEFRGEATNFVNAFTSVPLCTPARGSLFTGKWPHQNGTVDNVQGTSYYPHGKLHPIERTYLERLQDQGYEVSFIGKWHLGAGTLTERGISDAPLSDGGEQALVPASDLEFSGPRLDPYFATVSAGTPMDEQRTEIALERLRRFASSDRPFCLVISLQGPHFPHMVPQEWVNLYDNLPDDFVPDNYCGQFSETGKPAAQSSSYWPCQDTSALTRSDWRRTVQHYWGFCSYLDHLFGRVRGEMKALGLDQTTTTAFTADHGEMLGAHGWFDKGPFFYEEVMRIPMVMQQPGQTQPAERNNFVSFRDVFPSLIDSAGQGAMLHTEELDRSFWRSSAQHITYCYDAYQGRQFKFRGIRDARYKLAWSPHDIEEMYDLERDPGERLNVAGEPEYAAERNRLMAALMGWMRFEQDALAYPGHHLPVGSYIDGRRREEQHQHAPQRKAK